MRITEELAELCGIIAGDGHIHIDKKRGDYRIDISGGYKEIKYYKYVASTFKDIFQKEPKIDYKNDGIKLRIHSKEIVNSFLKIGLPAGRKSGIIRIPLRILKNKKLSAAFLRGLADTDFSICFKKGGRKTNSYPRVKIGLASKDMIEDIKKILDRLEIGHCSYNNRRTTNFGTFDHYHIDINGRKNFKIWMQNIGFKNDKHLEKIEFWKKNGYYKKGCLESGWREIFLNNKLLKTNIL